MVNLTCFHGTSLDAGQSILRENAFREGTAERLRSIVSTVTSMTGREPIIIPTINIANAFRSESDKKIDG